MGENGEPSSAKPRPELSPDFREVVEASAQGFVLLDQDSRIAFLNGTAARFFQSAREQILGRFLQEFADSFDVQEIQHSAVPVDGGTAVWLRANKTERKRTLQPQVSEHAARNLDQFERALRESEDRRSLALEAANLGTWLWDIKRDRHFWSDRWRAIFEAPRHIQPNFDFFLGKIHPQDRARVRTEIEASLTGAARSLDFEFRVIWEDGSSHWVHTWGRSHFGSDGEPDRIEGVVADIDQRKKVEKELRQTTGTLRAIIDGSPMAIVATDATGLVAIWNHGAERILGYPRDAVIGKSSPFPFETGAGSYDREYRARRSDGREIEVLCSVAPFEGTESGRGYVAMFSDVTEKKRLRRQMESAERWESLGVLAGGLAHDFNNLLTGILGNASLGLYSLDGHHEVRPLLEDILHAGERAAALTRQLLAYAGKGRFVAARLDLSELAREITALAQTSVQNKRVRLRMDLQPEMPLIEADPGQLQQVLLNLVMNGAEAIEEGVGGTVAVSTHVEEVSDTWMPLWETGDTLLPGRYAVLEVKDNGGGMDDETRARIFEPFFSTKFTGRGLGLSAVLGIVRQHRGALSVQSAPGEGSTFRVLLPVIEETLEIRSSPLDAADLQGAGLILVVDDEETVRQIARRSLEHWHYRVVMAENGQAAIEILPRLDAQLRAVILDLTMPVMGGEEALEYFQRMRPDVPVILTSGYSEIEAMRRMRGKGVSAFLHKPFTAEQLGRKLRDVLKKELRMARENSELDDDCETVSDR